MLERWLPRVQLSHSNNNDPVPVVLNKSVNGGCWGSRIEMMRDSISSALRRHPALRKWMAGVPALVDGCDR